MNTINSVVVKECKEVISMINANIGDVTDFTRILNGFVTRDNATKWTMGRLIVRIVDSFPKGKDGRRYILNNTDLSKSALSKLESSVRFCLEKGVSFDDNMTSFDYSKIYVVSSTPTNFIKFVDKGMLKDILAFSKDDLEKVAKGEAKLYNRNGLNIKDNTKADNSADDSADDSNKSVEYTLVTDDKGIKYNIPSDILAKYKVEE